MFTLTDGRVCFLDLGVAEKIAAAAVRTGEPFWINCKWDGKKGSPRIWEVWLDVNAEKTRAAEESDPFSAVRAGIKRAVDRTFGAQQDGTFAVPATSPPASRTAHRSQPLPATELEWQLRKSAELEQLKQKLGVHSPEAASLDTPWAAMVRERAQANIELCQSGFSEEEEEREEELEPPDDFPEPPDDGLEPPEEQEQGEQQ
jgi:hypothetical protein